MRLKRFICLFLAFVTLCSCVVGCGNDPEPEPTPVPPKGEIVIEDTDTVFAEGGSSTYKIVVPLEASANETYAATELQKYVREATSVTLPIATDENYSFNENDKVISLGNTTVFAGSGLDVSNRDELNRDGFKVKLFGNTVVINGYRDIGVIYGAYEFLEHMIGFHPYTADEVRYKTSTDRLYMKDFDLVDVPDFAIRDVDGPFDLAANGPATAKMLRANAPRTSIPHAAETFYNLIPRNEKNLEEHPEWFEKAALQFCFNNQSALDYLYESCIKCVEDNPQGEYLHISPCDGAGYCTCDACKAEIDAYGYSGHLIIMVNKIVDRVEAWLKENYPDRNLYYVTMAYTGCLTFAAPVKSLYNADGTPIATDKGTQAVDVVDEKCRPHEKLYIQITPLDYCFSHAWNDTNCTTNRSYYNTVDAWRQITDRLVTYDYGITFTNYFMFFDNYDTVKENLLYYKEMNITGISRQGATGASWFPFCELQNYLFGRLTWDTDQDVNELIDDFIDNYYKTAAPYIKEYFYLMRSWIAKIDRDGANNENYTVHFKAYNSYRIWTAVNYPKKFYEHCAELFEKAIAACDPSTVEGKTALSRVEKEKMGVDFMRLDFYETYYPNYDAQDFIGEVIDFERTTSKYAVDYWKERNNVSKLIEEFKARAGN